MKNKHEKQLTIILLFVGVVVGLAYKIIESPLIFRIVAITTTLLAFAFFSIRVPLEMINEEWCFKKLSEFGPVELKKILKRQRKLLVMTKISSTIAGDKERAKKIQEKIDFLSIKLSQI